MRLGRRDVLGRRVGVVRGRVLVEDVPHGGPLGTRVVDGQRTINVPGRDVRLASTAAGGRDLWATKSGGLPNERTHAERVLGRVAGGLGGIRRDVLAPSAGLCAERSGSGSGSGRRGRLRRGEGVTTKRAPEEGRAPTGAAKVLGSRVAPRLRRDTFHADLPIGRHVPQLAAHLHELASLVDAAAPVAQVL